MQGVRDGGGGCDEYHACSDVLLRKDSSWPGLLWVRATGISSCLNQPELQPTRTQPPHKRLAEGEAWEFVSLQGYALYSPRKGASPAGPMSPCVYITCPPLAYIASFLLLILTESIAQADLELCILLLLSPECRDYRHDMGIELMALGILGKRSLS